MRFGVCQLVLITFLATLLTVGSLPVPRFKRAQKKMSNYSVISPAHHCTFHNVKYNISQTWHPLLLPYGYFSCIKCTCTMFNGSAKVVCKKKECNKSNCSNAHIVAGDCCKKCPGPSTGQANTTSSCSYMGTTHAHGSVWETSSSDGDNLCTECSCSDGFVSCAIRICPKLNCSQAITSPRTCCKKCPTNATKSINQTGCDSLGRHYQEGEQWKPLISSYKHKCIICTCKKSRIRCRKVSCKGPNCNKQCCKKCKVIVPTTVPPTTRTPTGNKKQGTKFPDCFTDTLHKHNTTWKPIIGKKSQACVTCKCFNSSVSCARIVCPSKYPCKQPFQNAGECCLQCKGQSPTKVHLIRLGPKKPRCGSGNSWLVYEYSPATNRSGGMSTSNDSQIHGHFILESTTKDKVQIHIFYANKTYKYVRVQEMYKADLQRWKQMTSPSMKLLRIGIIKDAKRQKLELRKKRKCTNNCVQLVKKLIKMVRSPNGRWCRSPVTYGIKMLQQAKKNWNLLNNMS